MALGINNETIRDTFYDVQTLENIVNKEIKNIKGNKANLDKIVPEELIGTYSKKQKDAETFSDRLYEITYDYSVVALISSFEKIVFAKYQTSYGKIKRVVKDGSARPLDYFNSREKFIKDDIDKLHQIIELIEGHVDPSTIRTLKGIKDQRDYIAHGKRFSKSQATNLSLLEIARTLDSVISAIEK